MTVTEYLYVDQRRVDSYFEQVSDPVKYDKVPIWKMALGLAGPSTEGTQSRPGRAFTQHEKITELLKRLAGGPSSRVSRRRDSEFAVACLSAVRAFIPSRSTGAGDFPGLAIWIGLGAEESRDLDPVYLIENFPRDDESRSNWSGMSALWMLTNELSKEWERCGAPIGSGPQESLEVIVEPELFRKLEQSSHIGMEKLVGEMLAASSQRMPSNATILTFSNRTSQLSYRVAESERRYEIEVYRPTSPDQATRCLITRDTRKELAARFALDPVGLLRSWGAITGPERVVDVLFRIRHTMIEESVPGGRGAILGYPLVIAEHESQFCPRAG